jgi:hypothetical protein
MVEVVGFIARGMVSPQIIGLVYGDINNSGWYSKACIVDEIPMRCVSDPLLAFYPHFWRKRDPRQNRHNQGINPAVVPSLQI